MVFLHLGDLHLGKALFEYDLIDDQKYILEQVLSLAEEKKADAVLLAGDIYDRAIPSEKAVELLDWFLSALAEKKIPTFLIAGNHDSDERLNFGSSLFRSSGIYVAAKYDGALFHCTLRDDLGPVNIWLMPFVKASQVRHFFEDAEISNYDDAIRAVLAHADIHPEERNILVAHQFVAGADQAPALGGSESAATRTVGLVEQISYNCFDAFDYVALGHIHSAQAIGRPEVRYAGSPMKYSLSEVDHTKYATIITLREKGKVDISLEPLTPLHDLRHLKGPMKKLLENVTDPEDFIYATLTDEDPIENVMGTFQQYYPRTLRIDYDNTRSNPALIPTEDDLSGTENRGFDDILADFYKFIYGEDISEEEQTLMREAAKEAGILDETD